MSFPTAEALLVAAALLVPGSVWTSVTASFVARKRATGEVRLVELLTLSCANAAIWAWPLFLVARGDPVGLHPAIAVLLVVCFLFVSPGLLGLLSGLLHQKAVMSSFLNRLGFLTLSPVPTAWDYRFSQLRPSLVIVTLRDGRLIYGLFGYASFAGGSDSAHDLYLERIYVPLPTREWAPVTGSEGVLICADEIGIIEFVGYKEVGDAEGRCEEAPA